jgi:hypothetical protein
MGEKGASCFLISRRGGAIYSETPICGPSRRVVRALVAKEQRMYQ